MPADKLDTNLGYIYENVVAQMLTVKGNKLFHYTMESDTYRDQDADKTPIKGADKALSVNEKKVIEYLQANQAITNKMVQELCCIKDTASKNLLR